MAYLSLARSELSYLLLYSMAYLDAHRAYQGVSSPTFSLIHGLPIPKESSKRVSYPNYFLAYSFLKTREAKLCRC
jgi:hypothetical protein